MLRPQLSIRHVLFVMLLQPLCAVNGGIIMDNTMNPGKAGVTTNLATGAEGQAAGCTKDQAMYENACNSFSISDIQVMQRTPTGTLALERGIHNVSGTSYSNRGQSTELTYFANGKHLFDLDKLRNAANALGTVTTTLPVGSYGTISWAQFIDNIVAGQTMYGIVRVIVPLSPGPAGKSALGTTSPAIYGFCASGDPECGCVPTSSTDIKPGSSECGKAIPAAAQIHVKGTLFVDFVDKTTRTPLGFGSLPFAPRDIYFKVAVPINVNAANDKNGDGALDNIDAIAAITATKTCTGASASCSISIPLTGTSKLKLADIPAESLDAYRYEKGAPLTAAALALLPDADQYHLLMPSGYTKGWLEAFTALGITPAYWASLGFGVPAGLTSFTEDAIRSEGFEDIPAYLYSGGLVDMHHHVNISGLMYVPQGMELEQKASTHRQYVSGAVVVRDAFFIEDSGGITLLSSDIESVSKIKTAGGGGSAGSFAAFDRGAAKAARAKAKGKTKPPKPSKSGSGNGAGTGGASGTGTTPTTPTDPAAESVELSGPQWVEVRPH